MANWHFVVRMAGRETRASWRRLAFFFVCVAVGVAAIVALRSVIQHVRGGLAREARMLMAADVSISSSRPWTPLIRERIDRQLATRRIIDSTMLVETATMVRPDDPSRPGTRMVELQAVDDRFPLYGEIVLADGRVYTHDLLRGGGALVRPELLTQIGVEVGDELRIGESAFEIRGVIQAEPGRRLGFFSLGSRVLIDAADLEGTGLLTFGSRASYRQLLRVADADVDGLVRSLRREFANEFVNARSFKGREDQIGEDLERTENYLSLVGFVIVVLGGIGVWSVTRVFVQQKLRAIAILKCVGATSRELLAVYVFQLLALAVAGCLLGVVLASIGLGFIPTGLWGGLVDSARSVTWGAVAQGFGVGTAVTLLFALVPLLEVRAVKPLLLLRDEAATSVFQQADGERRPRLAGGAIGWRRSWPSLLVALGLVGVAAWQAGSLVVGAIVCAGFLVVALVLHGAGWLLVRAVAPLARARWFPLRHAVLGLNRPGNQTRVVLLAVGLGTFFIMGVHLLQANLMDELAVTLRTDGPDMFLLDVQQDQREPLTRYVEEQGTSVRLLPVLRARVTGVEGRDLVLDDFQDVRGRGSLAREYTVTYRPALEENERVVQGAFWDETPSETLEVSIEESLHERFDLQVGDLMRFDILGRVVEARVTSIRHVEWADSRSGGFMFVFRPGVLDQAPHGFVGVLRGPERPEARVALQRGLVERFPNVSAIDIRELARTVQAVVESVALAISIIGTIALLSGVLILVGSVAMTKMQRLYESALFKTLGAPTSVIAVMIVLEYATLGALAGAVGATAGEGLSWALSRHVLDIPWSPRFALTVAGIIASTLLVGTVGVAASVDVLRRKPLGILRAG